MSEGASTLSAMVSKIATELARLKHSFSALPKSEKDPQEVEQLQALLHAFSREVQECCGGCPADDSSEEEQEMNQTVCGIIWGHAGNLVLGPKDQPELTSTQVVEILEHRQQIFDVLTKKLREGKPLRMRSGEMVTVEPPFDDDDLLRIGEALEVETAGEMRMELVQQALRSFL